MFLQKYNGFVKVAVFLGGVFCLNGPVSAGQLPQKWMKVCNQQNGINICNVVNTVISDTGQPLTTVNVIELQKEKMERRLRIIVPTGRLIPEGVRVQIGNMPVKKAEYVSCIGSSCIADATIDDSIVDSMKKADQMLITSVNFLGSENPITVSLKGFGTAFNGKALTEEEYTAEQQKNLAPLQGKIKSFDSALKAAQEEAKKHH